MRFVAALLLLATACATAPQLTPADAERDVRALERRWLDMYEQRDAAAMEPILTDDFVITYPNGNMQRKADVLAGLRRAAGNGKPAPRFTTESTVVHVYGDTVVLTGTVTTSRPDRSEASRYTDTYVWSDGRWRVAASHLSNSPQKP